MASPVMKSTTNWADESADLSPDWSPSAAPAIPGDDHFTLEASAVESHQAPQEEHLPTGMGAPQTFCVYVGGLPYSATEDELGFFFLDNNVTPIGVRIINDRETGKSKGFGYLDFETEADYEAALSMSGATFGGRTIRVSAEEHRREPRRRSREPRGPRREDREYRRGGGRDSYRESDRSFREGLERSSTAEEPEHHERKKLELKPRSRPMAELHEDAAGRQRASIFGNAKPRDEAEYQRRRAEREERFGNTSSNNGEAKQAETKQQRSVGSTRAAPSEASSASPRKGGLSKGKGGKGRQPSGDSKSNWRGKGGRTASPKAPEVAHKEPRVRTVDTGPKKVKGALANAFAGLSDSESESDSEDESGMAVQTVEECMNYSQDHFIGPGTFPRPPSGGSSWSSKQNGFWDTLVGNAPTVGVSSGRLQILGGSISANNAIVTRIDIQIDPSRQRGGGGDLRVGTFTVKPAEGIFESETCHLSSPRPSRLVGFNPSGSVVQTCTVSPPLYLPPGHHVGIWLTDKQGVLAIPYQKTLGIMDDEDAQQGHWSSVSSQDVVPGRAINVKRHFKRKGCWRAYLQSVQNVQREGNGATRRSSQEKKRSYDEYMNNGKRRETIVKNHVESTATAAPILEELQCQDDVERERRSVEVKWGPRMAPEVRCMMSGKSRWPSGRHILALPPLLAFPWLAWRLLSGPPEAVSIIDRAVSLQLGPDRRPPWTAYLSRLFWSGTVPTGMGGAIARINIPLVVKEEGRWALWMANGTLVRQGGSDLSWNIQSLFLWDRTYYNRSPSRGDASTADLIAGRTGKSSNAVKAGLQSGTVMLVGDAVAQTLMGTEAYSPERSARFALVGCTLHGPYFFLTFRQLDRYFGPAVNIRTILAKTAAAQVGVFPIYLVALFAYLGALDGVSSIRDNVAQKAPEAFMAGCGFWPVANIFGFKFLSRGIQMELVFCISPNTLGLSSEAVLPCPKFLAYIIAAALVQWV
ncbi:hypothetical protein FOL47_010362 [Perkinsus chesapeaki]|uniref:RRM domain-containing protein n=1 Tax=Perkinsus chesapeaki TaxID=330153 RepID=A0A7J6N1I6_PERCH|nr:hypothetical protein FOL47_010362 [Perkinsus chesapeaki]